MLLGAEVHVTLNIRVSLRTTLNKTAIGSSLIAAVDKNPNHNVLGVNTKLCGCQANLGFCIQRDSTKTLLHANCPCSPTFLDS